MNLKGQSKTEGPAPGQELPQISRLTQGHDEDDQGTDLGRQFLRPRLDVHLEFRFIDGLESFNDVRVPVFEAFTRVGLSGYRAVRDRGQDVAEQVGPIDG